MVNIDGILWFSILLFSNVVYIKFSSRFAWKEMLMGFKKVKYD